MPRASLEELMRLTDPTPENDSASSGADTPLSPGFRPEVMVGPEHEQRRRAVQAALFGGAAEAATFGRYRLLHRLGEGGMGSVYAAYDDHLDRKIAVKLIRASTLDSAEVRERTLREARALARLSHPNVVHVYEVGEIEGQLFVAMEFLAGPTLRTWLDGQERPWREALAVLRQAGEGLAAAHAQGIVHRDFKPHNAMFGADGRVRVLDFGLARLGEGEEPRAGEVAGMTARVDQALTLTGTLLGTPAYMAPEQLTRGRADARSDQFTFCVVLYEALYGKRPFAGETLAELAEAITTGRVAARLKDSRVPQWVHAALLRGLQTDPPMRWPSMRELLAALERDPGARARRIATTAALLVGVGAIAGGVEGYRRYDVAQRVAACEAEGAAIDAVWNDDARQRLRDAFVATGVSFAETTAEKVIPWLTAQADAWRQARTESCLNARVRGTWDEDALERSVWCLDERRQELEAWVAEFSKASAASVKRSVTAAAKLSQVKPCLDAGRLGKLPSPPQDWEGATAVMAMLVQASAKNSAGKYEEALEVAQSALARAETLGWPSLVAAARGVHGFMLFRSGKYAAAEVALEQTYFQAAEAGAWEVAATAANRLIHVVGYEQSRHDEGQRWSRHGEVLLSLIGADEHSLWRAESLGNLAGVRFAAGAYDEAVSLYERCLSIYVRALGPGHPEVSNILANLAAIHRTTGAYDKARALGERALAIEETELGPDHPDTAITLATLAAVHRDIGAYDQARALNERALTIMEKALGPDHPDVAGVLQSLAYHHSITGAKDEAKAFFERVLAIRRNALGPDHPDVASTLDHLASVLGATGADDEAKALGEQALAIREKALGPDHLDVAHSLNNLAGVHYRAGRYDEARGLSERALAIREKRLGQDHPDVATSYNNLANLYKATGAYDEAKVFGERGLAIREKVLGPDHPNLAYSLALLADVALRRRRLADALSLAERAVHICGANQIPAELLAESRFILARALWSAPPDKGRDRDRALALARQALDTYQSMNGQDKARAEVQAFLKAHTGAR